MWPVLGVDFAAKHGVRVDPYDHALRRTHHCHIVARVHLVGPSAGLDKVRLTVVSKDIIVLCDS